MDNENFQTPPVVAAYMASLIPTFWALNGTILEPTPGKGNLVTAIKNEAENRNAYGNSICAPERFEDIASGSRFNCAVMNPPFTPMKEGYRYLTEVMRMTDDIIALLPWFIIINSQKRLDNIMDWGLVSVINLPRKTFAGSRIQCCVLVMKKGYSDKTEIKKFNW